MRRLPMTCTGQRICGVADGAAENCGWAATCARARPGVRLDKRSKGNRTRLLTPEKPKRLERMRTGWDVHFRELALTRIPLCYWGVWALLIGLGLYFSAILLSVVRLLLLQRHLFVDLIAGLLWASGLPTTIGVILMTVDLAFLLPLRRRGDQYYSPLFNAPILADPPFITVALTAYNDELSIATAVHDFLSHPRVKRVVVVSNNSKDRTMELARDAGAIAINENQQGYGRCVYRCLAEAVQYDDTELIALCEGDRTFRAADLDKFVAYIAHAEIVNGTRIVEQLRERQTQLSTFMYYGNFFAGKLLEVKHLGNGTFTDVGTTYKMMRRRTVVGVLPVLNPAIKLEFNAHFLDTALRHGFSVLECPITFHSRVGVSMGGNINNRRALKVGLRMLWGLTFGWSHYR